jgi:hypothetical protein
VRLTLDHVRHGIRVTTERRADELGDVRAHLRAIANSIRREKAFPARVTTACATCDVRKNCHAYRVALEEPMPDTADPDDLEAVARERNHVAARAKIAEARKRELDAILKAHVAEHGDARLADTEFRVLNVATKRYPLDKTATLLGRALARDPAELVDELAVVDNRALAQLIKRADLERPERRMLETELDAIAEHSYSARLWAKEVRP